MGFASLVAPVCEVLNAAGSVVVHELVILMYEFNREKL